MKRVILPYTIEPFGCTILFAYSETFDEVKDYIKDKKVSKAYRNEINSCDENQDGLVLSNDENDFPYLIYIKKRPRSDYLWEVLLHETNHVVFYLAKHYCFRDETEFQATLQESLFRNFKRLINKK